METSQNKRMRMNKTNSKTNNSVQYYGRILLFISATLYTPLTVFVIDLFLAGGEEFIREDFGGAWVMLSDKYPNVAEDFLHTLFYFAQPVLLSSNYTAETTLQMPEGIVRLHCL